MDDINIDLGSVRGPQGAEGKSLYLGEGGPDSELGSAGCTYMDTETGQIYEKTSSDWEERVQVSLGSVVVDPSLDPDSSHAVRNSAIAAKFSEVAEAIAGKQNALTIDEVPTSGSENPVMSGGVKSAIDAGCAVSTASFAIASGGRTYSGTAVVRRQGNLCCVAVYVYNFSSQMPITRGTPFAQLPDGFRPGTSVGFTGRLGRDTGTGSGMRFVSGIINAVGQIEIDYMARESDGSVSTSLSVDSILITAAFMIA